ncbi:MAG: hypothetical protein K2Q21_02215 [Chitinophagaceae bacterium]|nr:hypothetical protein [Chitinophagaceae bacterium]
MFKVVGLAFIMGFSNLFFLKETNFIAPLSKVQAVRQIQDTIPIAKRDTAVLKNKDTLAGIEDTVLRINNLQPYITLAADSVLLYQPELNKEGKYFWFLRNAPVGLQINKDNGRISFKASKSYFLSGKLKYDHEYRVVLGVNKIGNPTERLDTSFILMFYNTEIIPSKLKLSVSPVITIEEGDTLNFKVQCDAGSFPIENITYFSNMPLKNVTSVRHCDDDFSWSPGFDFVKDSDSGKIKIVVLNFVGATRFQSRDTAQVKVIVKDALNYPLALSAYQTEVKLVNRYILELKYSFLQLDKSIKRIKDTRTTFDVTASATTLTGTIMTTSTVTNTQQVGKILPSVGISLVPIKEAVSPQRVYDQNQASAVRTSIKRLEYRLADNSLIAERDPAIVQKTNQLKDELKQIQLQLIDVPLGLNNDMTEEELDKYFNSPKVMKKYRLKH